jgi:glutamyl-tRNA synthetase
MPDHGFTVRDTILGDVTIEADKLDDFVILKGDGWPTYHFAVVVDDEAMLVTHVLRGQEHLMNTPNHMALQEAFGFHTPVYAHLPIILNMDGSKMSKREKDRAVRAAAEVELKAGRRDDAQLMALAGMGDAALFAAWRRGDTQLEGEALRRLARALAAQLPEIEIHDFRVSGYLPEVLINFIALMGWSPGDDREKMTIDEMCGLFAVERIGKTNAKFDREKLLNFNTTAIAAAPADRKLAVFRDFLAVNPDSPLRDCDDALLGRLIAINEGFRTFRDIERKCEALFAPDDALRYDEDAVKKVLLKGDGAGLAVLRDLAAALEKLPEWNVPSLEAAIRAYGDARGLNLGKVAQPLRVAVTGTTISPQIFETLDLLGRERTLARIRRTYDAFRSETSASPTAP